jgi:hypothetical protein
VARALAGLLDQRGYVVAGEVEQLLESLCFFIGVNVDALGVFNQRPFECLCIVDINYPGGNGEELGQHRGAITSRSGDDLEASRMRTRGDGLDKAMLPYAFGELVKL